LGNMGAAPSEKAGGGIFYGWVILATGMLVAIIVFGFLYSFGVFFKDLQTEFNATRASIAIIASLMNLSQNAVAILTGWATDKYGPRITVATCGVLFCAGLFLSSRATSLIQLYISIGILVGCGISVFFPYVSTLARWFVKLRGLTQGMLAAGIGIGMMILNPISARLLANYGWRTTFVILGIAGIAAFTTASLLVRKNPEEKGLKPYGMTGQDDKIIDTGHGKVTLNSRDMTLKEATKTRDLWLLAGVMCTLLLAVFMVSTHFVNYAKDTGMSPTSAALLMTLIGAASILGKIGSGSLSDKFSSRKIVTICAIIETCLMLWLSTSMNVWMFRVLAIIHGLAYGGAFASFNIIIAETFGVTHMGKILGLISMGGAVGGILGPWIAGYVFDTTGSYSVAFLIAAGSCVLTVVCLLFMRKHPAGAPQA